MATLNLPCTLVDDDRLKMGADLSACVKAIEAEKAAKKIATAGFNKTIKKHEATQHDLNESLLAGVVYREVEVRDEAAGAEREVVATGSDGYRRQPRAMAPGGAAREAVQTSSEPATDAARQWDGWGTALKPATEHWILVRKPLAGTVAANVQEHGTGALNVDACRIPSGPDHAEKCASVVGLDSNRNGAAYREWTGARADSFSPEGRWPANLILSHSEWCEDGGACLPGCPVAMLDAQSGTSTDGVAVQRNGGGQKLGEHGIYGGAKGLVRPDVGYGRTGGASRFFYVAKPTTAERELDLELFQRLGAGELTNRKDGSDGLKSPRAGAGRTSRGRANGHPTVKSVSLMSWLCKLVTPPGGLVLDPFAGSGSTGVAALRNGFRFLGWELNPDYHRVADARIASAKDGPLFARSAAQ